MLCGDDVFYFERIVIEAFRKLAILTRMVGARSNALGKRIRDLHALTASSLSALRALDLTIVNSDEARS